MSTDIIKYETDTGEVALSSEIVRQYLVPKDSNVTSQEVAMFLELCKYQHLNPFIREVYLIKYGNSPATMVTGKEVFTKRAAKNPRFDGFEAGIIVRLENGAIDHREGAMLYDKEKLLGGWARVYLKATRVPVYAEASWKEYGKNIGSWKSIPETMIRKVALVQALREAFPDEFQGLYDMSEMGTDDDAIPSAHVEVADTSPSQREPIQAEVIEVADTVSPRDYTRLTELKTLWAEAFCMSVKDAGHAIVDKYGNPAHMSDQDYQSLIEKVEKYIDKSAEVGDLEEMEEVAF